MEAGLGIALMNDIYARTAEAEVAVVPLAPARIVEIGIAAVSYTHLTLPTIRLV